MLALAANIVHGGPEALVFHFKEDARNQVAAVHPVYESTLFVVGTRDGRVSGRARSRRVGRARSHTPSESLLGGHSARLHSRL